MREKTGPNERVWVRSGPSFLSGLDYQARFRIISERTREREIEREARVPWQDNHVVRENRAEGEGWVDSGRAFYRPILKIFGGGGGREARPTGRSRRGWLYHRRGLLSPPFFLLPTLPSATTGAARAGPIIPSFPPSLRSLLLPPSSSSSFPMILPFWRFQICFLRGFSLQVKWAAEEGSTATGMASQVTSGRRCGA